MDHPPVARILRYLACMTAEEAVVSIRLIEGVLGLPLSGSEPSLEERLHNRHFDDGGLASHDR